MKKTSSPKTTAAIDPVGDPTLPTAGFTLSPSTFPPGQSVSALLFLSPLNTAGTLSFDQNDIIGATFDSSFGTVTSIDNPILVHSSTLSPSDFVARLGTTNPNKISIIYITAESKQFAYSDIICVKVTFTTSNTVGSTLLKYSSKFTGLAGLVPNLPYLTTSVVEFPIGPPAAPSVPLNPLQVATLQWQPANETGLDFTVGSNATAIAFDGANMWVTLVNNSVAKVRASDGTVLDTFAGGPSPQGIAFDGANMWVTNGDGNSVTKFRASDGMILGTFPSGLVIPAAIAFDGANMWITAAGEDKLAKIRCSDGAVLITVDLEFPPGGIAFDGANMWVTDFFCEGVSKIRASDGVILGTFDGGRSRGIAFDGANMWTANLFDNNVTKLRVSDATIIGTYPVGDRPESLAFDGVNIWVANNNDNNLTKLRASDGANLGTFAVGQEPNGVAFDGRNVWVSNFSSNFVSKR